MTAETQVIQFAGLRIQHDARVLRPRPWTELQSRWAAELASRVGPGPLLELCSGAGHIGLAAARLSERDLVCVDVAPAAAELTRRNADAAGLADRVEVRTAAMDQALAEGEEFAVVIADPPWVPTGGVARFPEDPVLAIDGGEDGLALARLCVETAVGHLAPGGSLLLQLGDRAQAVRLGSWAAPEGWAEGGVRVGEGGVVLHLRHP